MSLTAPIIVPPSASPAPFPWIGLLALSAAVFLSVTSEMLPTGLLPDMSRSLGVPQSQTGLLVSWFAFTVVLTSTPLALLTRRLPRHGLIVVVLVVFAVSNVATALAPTYELVVASRVLGGLAHGLFWGVVGAYSAHLVPKEQIGRAVSITISGGTLAFVFGVPLGTAAGNALGWRLSFLALAGLMLVGTVLVWRFLPRVEHYGSSRSRTSRASKAPDAAASVAGDGRVVTVTPPLRSDRSVALVLLVCAIAALTMIGHYTFYTYIAPFLIDGVGVDPSAVAPFLFAYGIAGAVGLALSGTVFGSRSQLGLLLGLAASAVSVTVLAVFSRTLPVAIVAFLLWGLAFGVIPALLQTRLLHTASVRVRDTASAVYTTAFNTGIGGGALLGAFLLERIGIANVPFVYVAILGASLVLVIVSDAVLRRRTTA